MAKVRLVCDGLDLLMDFDPSDDQDCEIIAEAFLIIHRRLKRCDNQGATSDHRRH